MGRSEPSHAPSTQQSFRKDQRAKHARAIINKSIPQILASDVRARTGIERAQVITTTSESLVATGQQNSQNSNSKAQRSGKKNTNKVDENTIEADKSRNAAQNPQDGDWEPVDVSIQIADTLTAARHIHEKSRSRRNVAILNMASPLRPGGGVLNGATSQEESLCVRTTLLSSLKEEWYRLPEFGGIWSPDVLVFRVPGENGDQELQKTERFYVDVISAAMTRFPEVSEKAATTDICGSARSGEETTGIERVYASQKDRDLALQKMRAVVQILKSQKTERVVLGAWGCGAYGNPVGEVCRSWKKALLGARSKSSKSSKAHVQTANLGTIKEIVFAIKDSNMAEEFAAYWGDNIRVERKVKASSKSSEADSAEQDVGELMQKIEALQLQICQVKTPMLKQGLEITLQSLQSLQSRLEGVYQGSESHE